jgi:hypothetical protein
MAATLVLCAAVVAFWQVMSSRSRRPLAPFQLTAADFGDFRPTDEGWSAEALPVNYSSTEPCILSYRLRRAGPDARRPVVVRLIHGYNMPDCMRFKGYGVELLSDHRRLPGPDRSVAGSGASDGRRLQVWRLTSDLGEVSVWVTSMIRTGDFGETDVDTRSMAFPRISTPDPPGWLPEGLTWRSLRHPVANFRQFLRTKWNNAHCDLWAFLRLRRAAWASDDLLTLVAASGGGPVPRGEEPEAVRHVEAAHAFLWNQLRAWRAKAVGAGDATGISGDGRETRPGGGRR